MIGKAVWEHSRGEVTMAWMRMMLGLAGVSAICSCAVVLVYLVTLDESRLSGWLDDPTGSVWLLFIVFAIFQFVFPIALAFGAVILWTIGYSHPGYGLLIGAVMGVWASATALIVPYCGAYTSLPAAVVGAALSGWTNAGPSYYLGMIAANVLFWATGVALIYLMIRLLYSD